MVKPEKKELFPITWENIAPPYEEGKKGVVYEYFNGCKDKDHGFRGDSDSYNPVNAWWLAEIASIAYGESEFFRTMIRRTEAKEVETYPERRSHGPLLPGSTQCFVAKYDDHAIVAFRGTESRPRPGQIGIRHVVTDWMTDAKCELVKWTMDKDDERRVHRGFKEALGEVDPELFEALAGLQKEGLRLWFTGHSLGAALATLAACRYEESGRDRRVQGLYTFGSPRVGDRAFAEAFSVSNHHRFVNNNDIVTRVPPKFGYRHIEDYYYIDSQGKIVRNPTPSNRRCDEIAGFIDYYLCPIRSVTNLFSRAVPVHLHDHVPLAYSVHIRNHLMDSKR